MKFDPSAFKSMGLDHPFKHLGKNCQISPEAVFYHPERIWIGDNVRIDDFCILSAQDGMKIGSFCHIGCHSYVVGKAKFTMEDYSSLSGRVSIYTADDDHSGKTLTNPTVPPEFSDVRSGPVTLRRHAMVACGSIVLPSVTLGEGSVLAGLSLASKDIPSFEIWGGIPARKLKDRTRGLLILEEAHKGIACA